MSEATVLKATIRQQAGSNKSAGLRKQGQLPAVVYGHKKEPLSVSMEGRAFLDALHGGNRIFDVNIDGQKDTLMIKEVQYDHLGKNILHVDFMRVNLSELVTVQVGIELRGTAEGTHQGGMIETLMSEVEIECKVSEIPDVLPVNIKSLQLNQAIHAGQIELPAGVKMLTDADAVVVICHEAASAVSAEAVEGEETSVQPEVITERRKDEASEK